MNTHPFLQHPHRTLVGLSIPVLFSLIAEPLTGLADTAFIKSQGVAAMAALGVGTSALSSIFWIFGFLGVGTQTQTAQLSGKQQGEKIAELAGLAVALALLFGALLLIVGWPLAAHAARLLGADGSVESGAAAYMRIRLLGGPAVIGLLAVFGVLRGLQDMQTPLWIAVTLNGVNIALDAVLIPGAGPVPSFGIVGAAWASIAAQWIGFAWGLSAVFKRVGVPGKLAWHRTVELLRIGGDLFVRSGMLTVFLLLTTRFATEAGQASGAAHQAIRGMWSFTVLGLDSLAITAQSLVGYFYGSADIAVTRQVARFATLWSFGVGLVTALALWMGRSLVIQWLVPDSAVEYFLPAWLVAMIGLPISALAFATDGVHWGTGDFGFLRNVMILASATGVAGLLLVDTSSTYALTWIWAVTILWTVVRSALGVLRVWPGIGASPFARS